MVFPVLRRAATAKASCKWPLFAQLSILRDVFGGGLEASMGIPVVANRRTELGSTLLNLKDYEEKRVVVVVVYRRLSCKRVKYSVFSSKHHNIQAFQDFFSVPLACSSRFPWLLLFSVMSSSNPMDILVLAARSLFEQKAKEHSSTTCPEENTQGPEIRYFVGELTFHRFATILAGGCAILSTVIVAVLIGLHAFNYSNPVQQRQVIRIVSLIPWVAIFSFLIVWQDGIGEYLAPSLDFGCAIALSSFLLFMCDLVLAHPGGYESLFGEDARAKGELKAQSPSWLKVRCRLVAYGLLNTI